MYKSNTQHVQADHKINLTFPGKTVIGLFLVIALFAFETFNFDTTRYALQNLLGNVSFGGLQWATILAVAFCAIDFAGLSRLFTPEQGSEEPNAIWYLMGAWLLGATMNALMTWWAVSLTLLSHDFGNEVMSREQLLRIVPIFVASLVWLTRILFIGAFSVAGEYIFTPERTQRSDRRQPIRPQQSRAPQPAASSPRLVGGDMDTNVSRPPQRSINERPIRRRPPVPPKPTQVPTGMHARGRRR